MTPEATTHYQAILKKLKVGESVLIPWQHLHGQKPKTNRERAVSDGKFTWVLQPKASGIEAKRIV